VNELAAAKEQLFATLSGGDGNAAAVAAFHESADFQRLLPMLYRGAARVCPSAIDDIDNIDDNDDIDNIDDNGDNDACNNDGSSGESGGGVGGICGGEAHAERYALSSPDVFCLSLLWPSLEPEKALICTVLDSISQSLDIDRLFTRESSDRINTGAAARGGVVGGDTNAGKRGGDDDSFQLRGFICYYGRHYMAIFQSAHLAQWLFFDDQRVVVLGDWAAVLRRCASGKLQPTLMFYERKKAAAHAAMKGPSLAMANSMSQQSRSPTSPTAASSSLSSTLSSPSSSSSSSSSSASPSMVQLSSAHDFIFVEDEPILPPSEPQPSTVEFRRL
jgi:hypothetical protein